MTTAASLHYTACQNAHAGPAAEVYFIQSGSSSGAQLTTTTTTGWTGTGSNHTVYIGGGGWQQVPLTPYQPGTSGPLQLTPQQFWPPTLTKPVGIPGTTLYRIHNMHYSFHGAYEVILGEEVVCPACRDNKNFISHDPEEFDCEMTGYLRDSFALDNRVLSLQIYQCPCGHGFAYLFLQGVRLVFDGDQPRAVALP